MERLCDSLWIARQDLDKHMSTVATDNKVSKILKVT